MTALSTLYYYNVGTVTVTAGSATVTGSGTSWVGEVVAGDAIEVAGRQMMIKEVVSATSLTLMLPWGGSSASGQGYVIRKDSPSRTEGQQVIEQMRSLVSAATVLLSGATTWAVQTYGNAPPGSPVTGYTYLVGAAPTGAWVGYAGYVASWTGTGWAYTAPVQGMRAYVLATSQTYERGASAWVLSDISSRQPLDATLTALAAVTTAADKLIYATGADAFAVTPITSAARELLDDTSASAMRTTLGVAANGGEDTISTTERILAGYTTPVTVGASPYARIQSSTTGKVELALSRWSSTSGSAPTLVFGRSRSNSIGVPGVAVQSGDMLAQISVYADDGTDMTRTAASIRVFVDGAAANDSVPGAIVMYTTAEGTGSPTEALRITGAGALQMGGTNTVVSAARHIQLRSYTVATLPSASTAGQLIYVSNGASNKRLAVSDGSAWRWPDGATVS